MSSINDREDQYTKRLHGQFFTTTNPFVSDAFTGWLSQALQANNDRPFIEPFAGANNIIAMLRAIGVNQSWVAFDVAPPLENVAPDVVVQRQNTLIDFPQGYGVAITNPPYLAKNSAAARKMPYDGAPFEDLYQKSLSIMLKNCGHVAAIIPETFIKQKLFHNRLDVVISLNYVMFNDTDHPVCLALFVPELHKKSNDFEIWQGDVRLGTHNELMEHLRPAPEVWPWKFNDPHGTIGLHGADGGRKADIAFINGEMIPSSAIKVSSRHNTRVSLSGLTESDRTRIIVKANEILNRRRAATRDAFMTAHRGLREDGHYRRRIEFSQARDILDWACHEINMPGGKRR